MVTGAVALVGAAVAGGLGALLAGSVLAGAAVGALVLLSPGDVAGRLVRWGFACRAPVTGGVWDPTTGGHAIR